MFNWLLNGWDSVMSVVNGYLDIRKTKMGFVLIPLEGLLLVALMAWFGLAIFG